MERCGCTVGTAESVADGMAAAREDAPNFAIVDLRLGDGSGLDVVAALREVKPDTRLIVLTGYGNIATAVAAVKAGAVDYPSKPADAETIKGALLQQPEGTPPPERQSDGEG